ncbi:alpha/beta fold hydrolase [Alcanivorax sp. S6407]|uniref:alpha/beta fold hydrolase n=1 Tax=Alcanivorax sp. S6407 TaxID=2926424 RepID=UPI001FF2273B|nr:alpha/beta fold hydrolase [Alcanivorax sp. S6407]MCK0152595.1 alpha/beta fold hydrolase [Alcanivorax sp. S6407]
MKFLPRTSLAPFVFILLALLSGCDDAAMRVYDMGLDLEKSRAGLTAQQLQTEDGIEWHVLRSEGEIDKPVVLLIHGFGGDAGNWLRFVSELKDDFYFVVPDLPGHGQTTRDITLNYRMAAQSLRLLKLMDALDISTFHAAGNSMGGAITLDLARRAPQRVMSMGLIDSAGLTRQTPEFRALMDDTETNPLIPRTADDFTTTLEWAMEKPPYMPEFFIDIMGQKKADNSAVAHTIFEQLGSDPGMNLEGTGKLAGISTPALVVWGQKDRLLGLDNVKVFLEELPNARSAILDDIGHVPMAEAPDKTADLFRTFWLETGYQ